MSANVYLFILFNCWHFKRMNQFNFMEINDFREVSEMLH